MPTLEDAIRVVTNRDYRATLQRSLADPAEMMPGAMVRALMDLGAGEDDARALIADAVEVVGGRSWLEHRRGGLRAGGPKIRPTWRVVIPAGALRDPGE